MANFGSGMGAQLGAARLLYGMGRSNALPESFFGAVDPKRRVPRNNVIFVGVDRPRRRLPAQLRPGGGDAELRRADRLHGRQRGRVHALLRARHRKEAQQPDAAGPGISGLPAAVAEPELARQKWGGLWMLVGIAFGAWKTRGFRGELIDFELPPEEA